MAGWYKLLFYDPLAGEGEFYAADGLGDITPLRTYSGWRTNWKQIIPGLFGGPGPIGSDPPPFRNISLLFYDGAGTGEFYTVDIQGEMALLRTHTGWQSAGLPWTHIIPIIPGNVGVEYFHLLFYDSAGTGGFWRTYGQGEIAEIRTHTGWQSAGIPWTHIIPINHYRGGNIATDLLFYDSAGTGAFYAYDGQGGIGLLRTHTGWQSAGKPWTHIIPLGYDLLLFYDSAGTGAFYRYDGQGGIAPLRTHTGWQSAGKPWTQITPVYVLRINLPSPGLLFYDGAGTGAFYLVDPQGEITLVRTNTDWPSGRRMIVC
jgi:hypothetical protein